MAQQQSSWREPNSQLPYYVRIRTARRQGTRTRRRCRRHPRRHGSPRPGPPSHLRRADRRDRQTVGPSVEAQTVHILGIGEFSARCPARSASRASSATDPETSARPAAAPTSRPVDQLRAQAGDAILLATGDSIGGTTPEPRYWEPPDHRVLQPPRRGRRRNRATELDKGADHISSLVKPGCRTERNAGSTLTAPVPRGGVPVPGLQRHPLHDSPHVPFAIQRWATCVWGSWP